MNRKNILGIVYIFVFIGVVSYLNSNLIDSLRIRISRLHESNSLLTMNNHFCDVNQTQLRGYGGRMC